MRCPGAARRLTGIRRDAERHAVRAARVRVVGLERDAEPAARETEIGELGLDLLGERLRRLLPRGVQGRARRCQGVACRALLAVEPREPLLL